MNSFMMRPRALKAGGMWTRVVGTQQLMSEGWGSKMVISATPSSTANRQCAWNANKWMPVPGIYRVVATGAGGGGGGGRSSSTPGGAGEGGGGGKGAQVTTMVTVKEATGIVVGIGGLGGTGRFNTNGDTGSWGVTASGVGVTAAGGFGGEGAYAGRPQGGGNETAHNTPKEGQAAWGGAGGNSTGSNGFTGGKGDFYLELVG